MYIMSIYKGKTVSTQFSIGNITFCNGGIVDSTILLFLVVYHLSTTVCLMTLFDHLILGYILTT